jgi:hypothetical protein
VSNVLGLATGGDNVLYAVANTTIYTVDTNGLATNPVNFGRSDLGSAGGQSFISEAAVIPNQKLMRCYLPGLVGRGNFAPRVENCINFHISQNQNGLTANGYTSFNLLLLPSASSCSLLLLLFRVFV